MTEPPTAVHAERRSSDTSSAGSVHGETLYDKVKADICNNFTNPEKYLEMNDTRTLFTEISAGMQCCVIFGCSN